MCNGHPWFERILQILVKQFYQVKQLGIVVLELLPGQDPPQSVEDGNVEHAINVDGLALERFQLTAQVDGLFDGALLHPVLAVTQLPEGLQRKPPLLLPPQPVRVYDARPEFPSNSDFSYQFVSGTALQYKVVVAKYDNP